MRIDYVALILVVGMLSYGAAQDVINPQTDASRLTAGTLAAARGGAGTITGALRGNGSGVVTQAACADLSNGAASCSTDTTNANNLNAGTLPAGRFPALTGDVTTSAGALATTLAASARLKSTMISFTRDISLATGNQGVTGFGFLPTACTFISELGALAGTNWSVGFSDAGLNTAMIYTADTTAVVSSTTGNVIRYSNLAATNIYSGNVNSYDADGFTIAWAKVGSPTGALNVRALCFR